MWRICEAVIAMGDALPFSDDFDRGTFHSHWFGSHASYVAVSDAGVLGMYKFGANYPGRGSHVASATYLVSPGAQGRASGVPWSSTASPGRGMPATWPCNSTMW